MVFPYGADVAVHYNAVEVDCAAIVPLHELQTPLVEVTVPSVPNLGVGDYVHCCCGFWFNGPRDYLIEGRFQLVNTAAGKQSVSFMCVFVHISNGYECKTSVIFRYCIC